MTTINLNDKVVFSIRPGSLHLFRDNPEIRITNQARDECWVAEAQLHQLVRALAPHIGPAFISPILCDIKVVRPDAGSILADEPDIAIPDNPPRMPRDPDPAQSDSDREWAEHGDDPSYFTMTGM